MCIYIYGGFSLVYVNKTAGVHQAEIQIRLYICKCMTDRVIFGAWGRITIGLETDYMMEHGGEDPPEAFRYIEV